MTPPNSQESQSSMCPCGLTKELCIEKHATIERDLSFIRGEQSKIRSEISEQIANSEARSREHMDTCEAHMLERLTHQKEIGAEITKNIKESYSEALRKVIDGLNLHRKDIDELQIQVPTRAIDRVVKLENTVPDDLESQLKRLNRWMWVLSGIGLSLGGLQIMIWKYYNHLITEAETLIKTIGG